MAAQLRVILIPLNSNLPQELGVNARAAPSFH